VAAVELDSDLISILQDVLAPYPNVQSGAISSPGSISNHNLNLRCQSQSPVVLNRPIITRSLPISLLHHLC
jgi:hypothetical protein